MRVFNRLMILSILVVSTGCAKLWNSEADSSSPSTAGSRARLSQPLESAGIGAAVGGGIGLIAGVATGAPAEGLMVGSLAGGAIGTGVGAHERAQAGLSKSSNKLNDEQKDIIKRSQKIKQQDIEIRELKKGVQDNSKRGTVPKISSKVLQGTYGGSAKSFASVKNTSSRGRYVEKTSKGLRILNKPSGNKKAVPYRLVAGEIDSNPLKKGTIEVPENIKKTQEKAVAKAVAKVETKTQAVVKEPVEEVKQVEQSVKTAQETTAVKEEVAKATTAEKTPKDLTKCKEAIKEAERGLNASTDADRLFYLRRASRLCPSEPSYHLELGKMYTSVGKKEDAKAEFRETIALDANNQVARDELSALENTTNKK